VTKFSPPQWDKTDNRNGRSPSRASSLTDSKRDRPSFKDNSSLGNKWQGKATLLALILSTLPVIALGGITYYLADRAINQQANEAKQSGTANVAEVTYMALLLQRQMQVTIGVGTGVIALLAGAIAILLTRRSLNPLFNAAGAAAYAARQLRRERGETGADLEYKGNDELLALEADLSLVARQVSNLIEQQESETERTQLLTDLTFRLRESLSAPELLTKAVEETRRILNAERAIFYRFNPDWSGNVEVESVLPGFPKAIGSRIADPLRPDYIEYYLQGRVRAIDDVYNANLTPCHLEILKPFAVKANLVAPVIKDEKLIGLLILHQCSSPRAWQKSEINFLAGLAMQVGFALDRGSLTSERKAESQAEQLLIDISQQMHESANSETVLNTVVREARKILKTDRVLVYRFNPDGSGTFVAECVASSYPKTIGSKILDPCFKERHIEQYRRGRVRGINDIYNASLTDCHIELLAQFAVKANLVVPIIENEELMGLLIAHQCSGSREWQESEINWFSRLAAQIRWALERVGLIGEIEQARQELAIALRPRSLAVSAASFGITIADATQVDYPLIYCNPAFEKMTGYSQAEMMGKNCRLLQGEETDPDAIAEIRLALREKRNCKVTLKNYRRDGTTFWNELTISPVLDELGRVTHFVGMQNDITSLRQIIQRVSLTAHTLNETTQRNQEAIAALSGGAIEQSQAIATALKNLQAIVISSSQVSDLTIQANIQAQETHSTLQTSEATAIATGESLTDIHHTVTTAAEKVQYLAEVARRISEVLHPVNDVALSTNVLAMNVAVEASRAGDDRTSQELMSVAEAVRSLAEQSKTASSQIEELIGQIQTAANEVVDTMQTGSEQAITGAELIERVQQQLNQLLATSCETSALVAEIDSTAVLHAENSQAIARTIQEVATIAQENSNHSLAVTDTFAYLSEVARELKESTEEFQFDRL
jgi:methyl-accepting chemotaxis protein PixJ